MTKTIEKLLLAMAFAGFMGAAFGAAFGFVLNKTAEVKKEADENTQWVVP